MSGFIKETLHHIDAWQGSNYSSGFAYTKVLNIPGLHKLLKKNAASKMSDRIPNILQVLNMPQF